MNSVTAWNSIEGLPKQFLSSLKILFDILDEKRRGYVRLQDIETRWHEDGVKGLPSGVTEALRKVAPSNGYLSFEQFVSGLKLALLTSKTKTVNNDESRKNETNEKENNSHKEDQTQHAQRTRQRLSSHTSQKSSSDSTHTRNSSQERSKPHVFYNSTNQRSHSSNPTAMVHPNNVNGQRPTQNWRNPNHERKGDKSLSREGYHNVNAQSGPPPRPERNSPQKSQSDLPPKIPPRGNTSRMIINELKNWQRRMNGTQQSKDKSNSDSKLVEQSNPAQNDIYVNISQLNVSDHAAATSSHKTSIKRRDSARRHTLSSGVDSNMIKRAKQLEEEKQMLIQGLAMADQARLWYLKQINLIEEKQKYVSKTTFSDNNLESMQERMNFEKARIAEVNHQIKTLVESSEKGFPLHMNLAITPSNQQLEQNAIRVTKEQNRQLTKEISQKSEVIAQLGDKIAQLEREKALLIRDLFEARSQNKNNYDDTTFM